MIMSMTGFGRAKQTIGNYDITVELRSVNHRYFEFSSRLPRSCNFLDEKLKNFCKEHISRGKVEVTVLLEEHGDNSVEIEFNRQYADAYITALRTAADVYDIPDDLTLSSLMKIPELFTLHRREIDEAALQQAVFVVVESAIIKFKEMRSSEGMRLAADIKGKADSILELVALIEKRSPQTVIEYRRRIETRMQDLLKDYAADEQRLLTETAIFADRIAVDEETVRLRSHIEQLFEQLHKGGAIGRKIDFLIQEMNRESNTIGSKAQDIEIARYVIEIKALIEKIREQIQNIE